MSERWLGPEMQGRARFRIRRTALSTCEGTTGFLLDSDRVDCPEGALVSAPAGAVHDFRNRGTVRAGVLNIFAPDVLERNTGISVDGFARHPRGSTRGQA